MSYSIKENAEEELSVERVIRCRKTHRYFKADGWTHDPRQADTFPNEMQAIRACVHHDLKDIELVLRSPGTVVDLFSTGIPLALAATRASTAPILY